jgi:hypothetical protein
MGAGAFASNAAPPSAMAQRQAMVLPALLGAVVSKFG